DDSRRHILIREDLLGATIRYRLSQVNEERSCRRTGGVEFPVSPHSSGTIGSLNSRRDGIYTVKVGPQTITFDPVVGGLRDVSSELQSGCNRSVDAFDRRTLAARFRLLRFANLDGTRDTQQKHP